MQNNLERYKKDLNLLIVLGERMELDLQVRHLIASGKAQSIDKKILEETKDAFRREYQNWYTEASATVRQLTPDRLIEFQELYKGDGKRKACTALTYNIQDWLNGITSGNSYSGEKLFDDLAITNNRFGMQMLILKAVSTRFESSLHDIRQVVQADLFDSELDAARGLLKSGFLRAAGAIAGVVLEKHLVQVASNHSLALRKQHPTINDFNELLKSNDVLDVPNWRNIQRLGDLRNLCGHSKNRDPTSDEVQELIDGTEKFTKTLF